MKARSLLKIATLIFLSSDLGCGLLQRSKESGYSDGTTFGGRGYDEKKEPVDTDSMRPDGKKLESALHTQKEIEQYSKFLPYFESEEERLEFLAAPGFEARQKWLESHAMPLRPDRLRRKFKEVIEAQDIAVGMPLPLVRKSWGEPDFVEVSGLPALHNERWRYNRFVSSANGYHAEHKTVIFEAGRVIG